MHAGLIALILIGALVALAAVIFGQRPTILMNSYNAGTHAWGRWMPVAATGVYLAVLAINLPSGGELSANPLNLNGYFSITELVLFFLAGPLFLTRIGSLVAAAITVYWVERMLGPLESGPAPALSLVAAALTVITVLGDQMPWLAVAGPNRLAQLLREVALVVLTIVALAMLFMGLVKMHSFGRWINATFNLTLPPPASMTLLIALFLGWLSVALGFIRSLAIPLLELPTLLVTAFVTDAPMPLFVVLFALAFALSLATTDRRPRILRRTFI